MNQIASFYSHLAVGVQEAGLRDLKEALAIARAHGISGADFSADEIEANTAELLREVGMTVASVHGAMPLEFSTDAQYRDSLRGMQDRLEKAIAVQSPYFMVVPLPPAGAADPATPEFVQAVRSLFAEMCQYAANKPIQLIFENFSTRRCPYTSYEEIDWLLEHNPTLKFAYDSGNFPLAGINEVEAAKRYANRTTYVHLKDLKLVDENHLGALFRNGRYYDSTALGDGALDNVQVMRILREGGYSDGFVTIETTNRHGFARALKSAEWLQETFVQLQETETKK